MAPIVRARTQLPACRMTLAVDRSTHGRREMSSRHSTTGTRKLIAHRKTGHAHSSCTHVSHNKSYTFGQTCSGAARVVTSASSNQSVKLAVIGGGIGGLTCARILQNHGHDVVIFEREPSRNARSQGGNLDMHEESGQWALRQAGVYDQYSALILEGGQDLRIVDHKAKVHWEEEGPAGEMGRPEIHRPALRNLLLDALHPGTIKWDRRLVGIEPQGSPGHTLQFADGATVTADVVIGADGARSCVRPLVTDAKASYCGAGYFDIVIPDVDASYPDVAKFAGRGSMCALWDNKAILSQRAGDGSVRAWATCRMPEDSFTKLQLDTAWENVETSKQAVAALFQGWAPELVQFIHACNNKITPRPYMALPVGIAWCSQPNVTLLGDAAHLMSPFAGEGANLAMQDGAELALELVKLEPADAIAAYEARMFKRAQVAAHDSAQGLDMLIAPDGAVRFAQFMRSAGGA
ncbi:hypothetical protein WJX77_008965 [Trebouxia sp. C0004]